MQARDAQGRRLKIHKLHQPGPLFRTREEAQHIDAGRRREAAPGWRASGGLVCELLHRAIRRSSCRCSIRRRDRAGAAQQLQKIFPERRVIGVQAREILLGGGNIHCITQQVPAPARRRRKGSRRWRRPAKSRPRQQGRLRASSAEVCAMSCSTAQTRLRDAASFALALIVTGVPAAGRSEDGQRTARMARSEAHQRARVRQARSRGSPAAAPVAVLAHACRRAAAWRSFSRVGTASIWPWRCTIRRRRDGEASDCSNASGSSRRMLAADGVRVVKVYLHADAKTQRKRLARAASRQAHALACDATRIAGSRNTTSRSHAHRRALSASDGPAGRALACHRRDGRGAPAVRGGRVLHDEMRAALRRRERRSTGRTARARAREAKRACASRQPTTEIDEGG